MQEEIFVETQYFVFLLSLKVFYIAKRLFNDGETLLLKSEIGMQGEENFLFLDNSIKYTFRVGIKANLFKNKHKYQVLSLSDIHSRK